MRMNVVLFVGCVLGVVSTYFVAISLVIGNGQINHLAIKIIYDIIFIFSVIIPIKNALSPIFFESVFNVRGEVKIWRPILILGVCLFQSIAIIGLMNNDSFQKIYTENFILLQYVNLIFLWSCACGAIGQKSFSKFWRDVMIKPIYAISYAIGKSSK